MLCAEFSDNYIFHIMLKKKHIFVLAYIIKEEINKNEMKIALQLTFIRESVIHFLFSFLIKY